MHETEHILYQCLDYDSVITVNVPGPSRQSPVSGFLYGEGVTSDIDEAGFTAIPVD